MCRVVASAVQTLGDRHSDPGTATSSPSSSPSHSLPASPPCPSHRNPNYQRWPAAMLRIAGRLGVDPDELRRQHVYQLYNSGHDKLAEEVGNFALPGRAPTLHSLFNVIQVDMVYLQVMLTVSDHAVMGSQLLLLAGQRLHHFVFVCETPETMDKLAKCSPTVSTWLRKLVSTTECNKLLFWLCGLVCCAKRTRK